MGLAGWISSPRTSRANSGSGFCWAKPDAGREPPSFPGTPCTSLLPCVVLWVTGVGHWWGWQKVCQRIQGCCSPRHDSLEQGSGPLLQVNPQELWRSQGKIPAAPTARQGQCPWHCDMAHCWCKVGVQQGAQTDYLCFVSASGLHVAGTGLEQGAGGWMWGSGRQMGLRPAPTCSHQAGLGVNPHHALPVLAAFPFWLPPLCSAGGGVHPPPSALPPAVTAQGIESQTLSLCHGVGSMQHHKTTALQPCSMGPVVLSPGLLQVTDTPASSAAGMCWCGGGPMASFLYSNL